jgi:hypothetical protein
MAGSALSDLSYKNIKLSHLSHLSPLSHCDLLRLKEAQAIFGRGYQDHLMDYPARSVSDFPELGVAEALGTYLASGASGTLGARRLPESTERSDFSTATVLSGNIGSSLPRGALNQ